MANPQTENGFLQIANEIWNEVIRRDFTKRQKDIILFIWRLSYGCKKKTAYVPMLKDFELCGVGPQNITKELMYLVSSRVIEWDKGTSIFSVNKDYERWQISPVRGWDEEKFKQLIHLNIEKKTSQNEKSEPPKRPRIRVLTSQNEKLRLLKIRSYGFLKREVKDVKIPCCCKLHRVSKESIKEIIKKRKITTANTGESHDPKTITEAYSLVFGGGTMPALFSNYLIPIMIKLGESYAIELILESGESGKNPSLRHIQSIHEAWSQRGVRSRKQSKELKAVGSPPTSHFITRGQQQRNELDELRRRREEERQRGKS